MSGDDTSNIAVPSSPPTYRRRSSFTTNKLSEMFSSARNPTSQSPNSSPPSATSPVFPGPVATASAAAAAAQRRRTMSISTLGLGGSAPAAGPPSATTASRPTQWGLRRGSLGGNSASTDGESAVSDESVDSGSAPPASPFGRRMSFGAKAMGSMRNNGEGFNWADNFARKGRSGSFGAGGAPSTALRNDQMQSNMNTAQSHQPPRNNVPPPPPPQMLKKDRKAPDHFQERILKGDFYMD